MKIKINGDDPKDEGKKKKPHLKLHRGRERRHYRPESVETGDPAYGKPGSGKKIEKVLSDARKHKQDVVHHQGLSYRAGRTEIEKEPDRVSIEGLPEPDLSLKKIKLVPARKPGKSMEQIRSQGRKETDRANPVAWVGGQGGGRGKSEGKHLGKKAVKKIRY